MKNLILTLIITLPLTLWGQGWEQTFGGEISDRGNSVKQTSDGGYIICGTTYSFGNGQSDVYLIKTDENGEEQWYNTFGGEDDDNGYSVQQTSDGGYIIVGSSESFGNGNSDIYLIKTDVSGNEQWNQTFGGGEDDRGLSVQQTSDGGYIITGYTQSFGNGYEDIFLIKTDENGNEQWSQTFGGDGGLSVQQTSDGGYIICGSTYSNGSSSDVYLIKTDENGEEQWSKTFGGEGWDRGYSVQQTTDGGYIITGHVTVIPSGNRDVYLIKTDGNGNEQWTQTIGGGDWDYGYSVQQTTDGGYIITGETWSYDIGECDIYLIKTDENGEEQWYNTFGGEDGDIGYSVQQTQDGGYIITGYTSPFGNGISYVYLIKTDGNGNITSTFEIPLPNPNRKLEKTVNLIGQEVKPQTGQPIIEIFDDGSVEKKIVVE